MPRHAPVYTPLTPRPRDLSPQELAAKGAMTLAEFLRVSRRTVEELLASGELPSAKLGRRRVVYWAAVELYLAQHRAA